jgi:5-methylcytosine-specific restriction endonuclease McrA
VDFELSLDNHGVADDVLLDDVRRIARSHQKDSISQDGYSQHGRFHAKTLVKRFGSWNKVLELSGLRIQKPGTLKSEDCVADLRHVAAKLERPTITMEEYRKLGSFTARPFYRLFGSWANALQEAGLEVSSGYRAPKDDEELHQNMESVWRTIGKQPKRSDMRKPLSQVSADTYCRRFGSWRKALEAFVVFVKKDVSPERAALPTSCLGGDSADAIPISTARKTPKTSRSVSWRLRFLVMRRDGFKCRLCGASPAIAPGTILVVDHVVAWSKGGETILGNLQTLCEVCNGGKSDLSIDEAELR